MIIDPKVKDAAKERKRMLAMGYEELGEGGGRIWEINRGCRIGHRIVDAIVSCTGRFVWVKVEPLGTIQEAGSYAL